LQSELISKKRDLEINPVTSKNSGTYYCFGLNYNGEDNFVASANVTILSKH